MKAEVSLLRVFPKVVEFKDVEAGITYVATIVVQNASNTAQRIRFKLPKTGGRSNVVQWRIVMIHRFYPGPFQLHYEPQPSVAAGLEEVVELSFTMGEAKDCHDELLVMCDSDQFTLPLHAYG